MSCRAPQGHRRTLRNMEKYEYLGMLGEGSYGMVTKCRNKENGRIVAIKKFLEGDDDKFVKKIAMREIRLLKRLRHENLVSLLEVFKKKGRWFLVFEYMDRTLLDDLEQFPKGLDYSRVRSYLFQILRGLAFCHSHNIIHRDIKLENILVSERSVLKLCDFGFARTLAAPGEAHTEYVATRWYRAPELLVGDSTYGKSVDVWAVGCLVTEMLTGEPLFPGDSDIDQLYLIIRCLGNLTPRHQELFYKNPLFAGLRLPIITETKLLEERYPKIPLMVIDLVKKCLHIDPNKRSSCTELLEHEYFTKDSFPDRLKTQSQRAGMVNPIVKLSESKHQKLSVRKLPHWREPRMPQVKTLVTVRVPAFRTQRDSSLQVWARNRPQTTIKSHRLLSSSLPLARVTPLPCS
ncbi:cyclin-dependent kinase-like 2 isoform X8 [Mobula birostris]|uniref:cyclin-dependent kinase-like 2 isoform X8 n=1 Tax=Mobula birostris TaxID=1983395 RepID=UPI003B28708A